MYISDGLVVRFETPEKMLCPCVLLPNVEVLDSFCWGWIFPKNEACGCWVGKNLDCDKMFLFSRAEETVVVWLPPKKEGIGLIFVEPPKIGAEPKTLMLLLIIASFAFPSNCWGLLCTCFIAWVKLNVFAELEAAFEPPKMEDVVLPNTLEPPVLLDVVFPKLNVFCTCGCGWPGCRFAVSCSAVRLKLNVDPVAEKKQ